MIRLILASVSLIFGMFVFLSATIGVNRYEHAMNRIHTAALGDTLGIFFAILGLVIWKGMSFVSVKMIIIVLFFWLASPVASHMLSRMELEIHDYEGELQERHAGEEEKHENL